MSRIFLFLIAGCVFFLNSCALNYGSKWESAAVDSDDLTGAWEGRWLSHSNGHTGTLRCVVTAEEGAVDEAGAGRYFFHYFATWGRIYRDDYEAVYEVLSDGEGNYAFEGDSDLGSLAGGVYRHEGSATSEEFRATYDSRWDRGILEMARPER